MSRRLAPQAEQATERAVAADLRGGSASDRELLVRLMELVGREVGAQRARLVLESGAVPGPAIEVDLDSESVLSDSRRAIEIKVPGGSLFFEGATGEPPEAMCQAALSAAVRSFDLSGQIKQQRFEVNYRGVELEAVYDVGLAIAGMLDLDRLSEEVLIRAISLLDARRGALYRTDNGEFVVARVFGGDAVHRLPQSAFTEPVRADGSPGIEVLPGVRHLLAVPITVEAGAKGLLVVGDKESREGVGPFQSSDRRTLELFANQAAIALENADLHLQALEKERLEREGELAAGIQRRLLPDRVPDVPGFELTGWNEAARMVGGDYYNYFEIEDGAHLVVVADVTGKGIPAALLVSTLDSALRVLLGQGVRGAELMSALNEHIWRSSAANTFITLATVELEPDSGRVRYTSAGHNPALLVSPSRGVDQVGAAALPLGLFEKAEYKFTEHELEPGALLCVYSDGITECEAPNDEEYGVARLAQLLQGRLTAPLAETMSAIRTAVTDYRHELPQGDDQTIVLIRRHRQVPSAN